MIGGDLGNPAYTSDLSARPRVSAHDANRMIGEDLAELSLKIEDPDYARLAMEAGCRYLLRSFGGGAL